ncbi:restriction endonuclease [Lactobacillus pasteurii DSM 23907 = CRBIP 24.76]|uniref:Eco57I restriction endonuclease n=1 Tax=Lactobacillus pasteurii DSM 23907 = CRBIP 24.76 TaxID=1423790 RepID=I7LBY5_9LACO|nr:Eco57I restriction-modification methylase domain-containing protein [Lactobacillus pasteurii]KRK08900.1 restriction endonuclease [Lactobacillus pasteurii DSM 23907 = CRBIP 24.76]TDG76265.1 hypothetical protein C5L33_001024 [Lactobacillus pasteurii]CCI86011.1 Eco57I restriction endonuclease [Lactobacillus pasteurii DSM 23907 = CRBIP 24.76]
MSEEKKFKFDVVIGNPPYQEAYQGNSTGANSIYDKFMDSAYQVGNIVELITPARFLFNAGSTSKKWNKKMLDDPHLKVLYYEKDSAKVFSDTDIKGGVTVTYRDNSMVYGNIGVFSPYKPMNAIIKKVKNSKGFNSMTDICVSSSAYHFTEKLHVDHPEILEKRIIVNGKERPLLSKGHEYDLKSSIFEKLPDIFLDKRVENYESYAEILGRDATGRSKKYIEQRYINTPKNFKVYKIFLPKADGNGSFGETLTKPEIEGPFVGATETFYSVGLCSSLEEINNVLKYIKSKFSRALLSVLKITQDVNPGKWKYVPLQDFTPNSDIDWTKSIPEIDQQLYKKYDLSPEEIDFIETHVKEMD